MKLRRLLSIPFTLLLLFGVVIPVAAQQSLLPLVLVVRDGASNPLSGITLNLLLAGPPHQPYDNCVTDSSGQCRLMLPPAAYIVTFAAGWRGREFIPADQQNGGVSSDGGLGGFGINFTESDHEQTVTFVVGQQADGKLVPIWDMSRDPNAPPQPFAVSQNPLDSPEKALEGINLAPLDTAIPSSADLEALLTPTAQQVISDYSYPPTPTVEVTALPSVVEPAQDGLPLNVILVTNGAS